MKHDLMELHAAAYVLGALDGADLAAFEAHLASGCDPCEMFLRESSETLAALAADSPAVSPPAAVKEALMRRAAVEAHRPPQPHRRHHLLWAVATAAAMILAGSASGLYVAARYEDRLRDLTRDADAYFVLVDLLRNPSARVINLRGTGSTPQAHARVIWQDVAGGQIIVANLPAAPSGKAYEIWTIRSGKPQPAGLFHVDENGRAVVGIPSAGGRVDVFAVTLEPAHGVPAPTGPTVLASTP